MIITTQTESAATLTANSPRANAATIDPLTRGRQTARDPESRFRVNALVAELRMLAERHPGMRISHFIRRHRLLFVTCAPRDDGVKDWTLRLFSSEPRPAPFSLAEEQWDREIKLWREQFAVPPGARQSTDPHTRDGCFAVLVAWTETDACGRERPQQLELAV